MGSTKLSAFVLVCQYVCSEVARFLVALTSLVLTFASMISVLTTTHEEFTSLPTAAVSLLAFVLNIHEADYRDYMDEPVLLVTILIFVVLAAIILLNLLIAQLNRAYEHVYHDMVGFARMKRSRLIVDMLGTCSEYRWKKFVSTLRLDQHLEFTEGDIGVPGGLPVNEPANACAVEEDQIQRFGGSCAPELPWPDHTSHVERDQAERMQSILEATRHNCRAGAKLFSSRDSRSLRSEVVVTGNSGSEAWEDDGSHSECSFIDGDAA